MVSQKQGKGLYQVIREGESELPVETNVVEDNRCITE